jgi:hypothetical protein
LSRSDRITLSKPWTKDGYIHSMRESSSTSRSYPGMHRPSDLVCSRCLHTSITSVRGPTRFPATRDCSQIAVGPDIQVASLALSRSSSRFMASASSPSTVLDANGSLRRTRVGRSTAHLSRSGRRRARWSLRRVLGRASNRLRVSLAMRMLMVQHRVPAAPVWSWTDFGGGGVLPMPGFTADAAPRGRLISIHASSIRDLLASDSC